MTRDEAEKGTILRAVVGSTAHGLNVQDGIEDRDEMGVVIEPLQAALSLTGPFEQFIYRSAEARRVEAGLPIKDERGRLPRSMAGDLDLTLYSLRKFCRLALSGNPTVMLPLYAEPLLSTPVGAQLRALAHGGAFVSALAGKAFLGYLQAQRQRLLGERGQKDINRPELVEKYGYDTKYAMHMLRLGVQGIEFMQTGQLSLPMQEPWRRDLYGVRLGEWDLQKVQTVAGELERELKDLIETGTVPARPDVDRVQTWMCRVYLEDWKANDAWWKEYPTLKRVDGANKLI